MANKFFGNWIVKNILGALAVAAFLVGAAALTLHFVTRHNQEMTVPDLTSMPLSSARFDAEQAGLRTEVVDSVYVRRLKRGYVFKQDPIPGSKVKKGRRISLTINAVIPKKVTMPNLVGYSMRQAKAELSTRGLVLGRLIYVSDIATNNVLKQLKGNHEIEAGEEIESESVIDLVLGLNPEDNTTSIPDVRGLKLNSAIDAVHENSLNIARVIYEKDVKTSEDSISAFVWRVVPEPSEQPCLMGEEVKLYLTTDIARKPVELAL